MYLRGVLLSFDFVGGVTFQMAPQVWKSMKPMSWMISEGSAEGCSGIASNVVVAGGFGSDEEENSETRLKWSGSIGKHTIGVRETSRRPRTELGPGEERHSSPTAMVSHKIIP